MKIDNSTRTKNWVGGGRHFICVLVASSRGQKKRLGTFVVLFHVVCERERLFF